MADTTGHPTTFAWWEERGQILWLLAIWLRWREGCTEETIGPRFRHLVANHEDILDTEPTDREIWERANDTPDWLVIRSGRRLRHDGDSERIFDAGKPFIVRFDMHASLWETWDT